MGERAIQCGVIGAGWWGTYAHIPALLEHPAARLVAIQTQRPEDAAAIAGRFAVPHACASADELTALSDLEAVVISSPPHMHYPQARTALERGLHVLVEKPMTLTAAEARELVGLAAARGRHLLISAPWHYTRHAREAHRLLREGVLGEPRLISVLMTNPVHHLIRGSGNRPTYGDPFLHPAASTYSDPAISGGGQIYAQLSHVGAYLAYLTDARPARVFARFHNDGARVDIYDALNVQLDNGCLATIASTGATPDDRRDFEVRIFGTRAILFLELWRGTMELHSLAGGPAQVFPALETSEVYPERAPARNLIDVVLGAAPNLAAGELGVAAMDVIEAACRSAASGEDVIVP